jgi:hypothetical protein
VVRAPAAVGARDLLHAIAADLDGDGDLDLLLLNTRLWRNVGNLTFVDATANLPAGIGNSMNGVAADFDGDGDTDIALVGLPFLGYSGTLVNQGNGVFAISTGTAPPPGLGVAAADFDRTATPTSRWRAPVRCCCGATTATCSSPTSPPHGHPASRPT